MINLHHAYTKRELKYINLDHKDIFDEDYNKVHTWFGLFTNKITFKVRNKIVDLGSDNRPVVVKGLKGE